MRDFDALANARYHDFSQMRGAHELVARHCPTARRAAAPSPAPSRSEPRPGSLYDAGKEIPAHITGNIVVLASHLAANGKAGVEFAEHFNLERLNAAPATVPVRRSA